MAWAMISMDALIMHQVKKGIFAGLPWFDNYWGRDSFISLPGATLVTGRFAEAREILQSFADWQETNPASSNEGRIPNLVTTTSIAFNTADGTPWFVSALQQYVASSGDTAFGKRLYPVVKRSVDGTLRHHADAHGFLVHGDAETWMDAVGPDGPWSPRGDRACDIQALWVRQLLAASAFARAYGDDRSADRWEGVVDTVIANFQTAFIDHQLKLVYDRLLPDGSPDRKLRPNLLFALDIVQDPAVRMASFRAVTQELVYAHGVGSLSPRDPAFHPFHHYEPSYVQDAAYHQGIVWTWLNGRWIQMATSYGLQDLAYTVTDNMVHQIL
jgi:predicted glycogen debranching enzyme